MSIRFTSLVREIYFFDDISRFIAKHIFRRTLKEDRVPPIATPANEPAVV
ncbi:MAG: hypothetical protein ABJA67_15070 [Chthonomonadales bacterium]